MIEYQLVHQIPGRIRIKIKKKINFSDSVTQVQEKISLIKGVTQVRVNQKANSIIINFNDQILSITELLQKLDNIVPQNPINTPTAPETVVEATYPPPQVNSEPNQPLVPENRSTSLIICQPLTAYEEKQLEKIVAWQSKHPNILLVNITNLLTPVINITNLIIPKEIVSHSLMLCEEISHKWGDHWEQIKSQSQVNTPLELQKANLELCDRLSEKIKNEIMISGTLKLGGVGLITGIGELASVPLSIIIALQTIQQIALCYGYTPEAKAEKFFAWTILSITTAQTLEEKQKAFSNFYNSQQAAYQENFNQILEEALTEDFLQPLKEEIFNQSVTYLAKNLGVELIPLFGYVADVLINRKFVQEVSQAAIQAYQVKWLISNQKIQLQSKNDLSFTSVKEGNINNLNLPKRRTNRKKSTNS